MTFLYILISLLCLASPLALSKLTEQKVARAHFRTSHDRRIDFPYHVDFQQSTSQQTEVVVPYIVRVCVCG